MFGCKVTVTATIKGGWYLAVMALEGNPHDGHRLGDIMEKVERIAKRPGHTFVYMGYCGRGYEGDVNIHVVIKRRGRTVKSIWRWMKRRDALEPGNGYLKREHSLWDSARYMYKGWHAIMSYI